nr:DUF1444 domain-containing protein [Pseudomonas sp. Y39-6]
MNGSKTTRQRHIRQAIAIQTAISHRWHRTTPWNWQRKHLQWFLSQKLNERTAETRYYYKLTIQLIELRMGKSFQLTPQHSRQ